MANGVDLCFKFGQPHFFCGNVRGEFDDLEGLAVGVHHRVVGGFDPDFPAALAKALVFAGIELTPVQAFPEGAVFVAAGIGRVDKQAVVPSPDFIQGIAKRIEKILVRGNHGAIEIEFDRAH